MLEAPWKIFPKEHTHVKLPNISFLLFFFLKELLGLRAVVAARRLPVNLYSVDTGVLGVSPVAVHPECDVAKGPGKLLL